MDCNVYKFFSVSIYLNFFLIIKKECFICFLIEKNKIAIIMRKIFIVLMN